MSTADKRRRFAAERKALRHRLRLEGCPPDVVEAQVAALRARHRAALGYPGAPPESMEQLRRRQQRRRYRARRRMIEDGVPPDEIERRMNRYLRTQAAERADLAATLQRRCVAAAVAEAFTALPSVIEALPGDAAAPTRPIVSSAHRTRKASQP